MGHVSRAGGSSLEEPGEGTRVEEVEEIEEKPRKRLTKKVLAAIVVAIVIGGGGLWYLFFSNAAPVADFRAAADDLTLSVSGDLSTDREGNIVSYAWNWGDPSSSVAGEGIQAQHVFPAEGFYNVTLTVTDAGGLSGSRARQVNMRFGPTPSFIARQELMTSYFDASQSFSRRGGNITDYRWDFGDGTTGLGVQATHTYTTPGKYPVRLQVTDEANRVSNTTRFVSPAATTVDILVDQIFEAGCPYDNYWYLRKASYGDVVLRSEVPCTDFYPWVLITAKDPVTGKTLGDVNPSYVYTLYRQDARVRNHLGYSLIEPVMFPVFDPSVAPLANSYVRFDLTFDYLNQSLFEFFNATSYSLDPSLGDGFGFLVRGNITMDLTTSRRIFGVQATDAASARTWWQANTLPANRSGTVEGKLARWMESEGKGKYQIYNAFEWYYQTDLTDLNATVSDDGTTTVRVFWDGWGFEVLLARWFYWGNASYLDAVCVQGDDVAPFAICDHPTLPYGAIQPKGWMPMESCWCERAKINGEINSTRLNLDWVAYNAYQFRAWANWGSDGQAGSGDELPSWVFEPILMDYVPRDGSGSNASAGYPNSELRWYEARKSIHDTPGSYLYGDPYEFLGSPTRWVLNSGSTLTIVLPRFKVPWYDPVQSRWNAQTREGVYEVDMANMTLRLVKVDDQRVEPWDAVENPNGFYLWDSRAKTISIAGPYTWPSTLLPLTGSPWIEFGPET